VPQQAFIARCGKVRAIVRLCLIAKYLHFHCFPLDEWPMEEMPIRSDADGRRRMRNIPWLPIMPRRDGVLRLLLLAILISQAPGCASFSSAPTDESVLLPLSPPSLPTSSASELKFATDSPTPNQDIETVAFDDIAAPEAIDSEPLPKFEDAPPSDVHAGADALIPNPLPVDLGTALEITAGQNPRVAFARERVREAYANWQSANSMWLPSIRSGFNYNKHEGQIQDVAGTMIDTSRGSIYTGLGAQAVGAASPAVPGIYMNFHLRDALFNPRIAERTLAAQRRANQANINDVLLETSLAYLDLLEAAQTKAVADDTTVHAAKLFDLTSSFAAAGQGLDADVDRAQTELAARRIESQRSVENVRVASARLCRLLSQDQSQTLLPVEPELAPIEMVDITPGLADLIGIGLSNRPELAESQFLVAAAVERLRREKAAPLVPSVLLGASYGGNGGGLGSNMNPFGDRFDGDVAAYWEIRNLGLGEHASRNGAGARVRQAAFQRVQVLDQVAAEIAEAFAQVEIRKGQIETARAGTVAAQLSYERNSERIQHGQGLPIETLQSIQALDQARRLYVRAVADYNRAQFRLHRALGWPALTYRSSASDPTTDYR